MAYRTFTTGQGSGSSSISVIDVTAFDDFTSSTTNSDGTNPATFVSGNFGTEVVTTVSVIPSEVDHPGIVRFLSTGDTLFGFSNIDDSGAGTGGEQGLIFNNDFDITFLNRLSYDGLFEVRWELAGVSDTVRLIIDETTVSYNIGAGDVATAVAVPLTTVWFKPRFVYTAGVLTIYIGTTVVFSGVVALVDGFNLGMVLISTGGGDFCFFDTDYVLTNYEATR